MRKYPVEEIIQEYLSEKPINEICRQFGFSKQTLYNILSSYKVPLNRTKLEETGGGCPFFKTAMYQNIYCTDCGEVFNRLVVGFASKEERGYYNRKVCYRDYEKCALYQMIMKGFEDG